MTTISTSRPMAARSSASRERIGRYLPVIVMVIDLLVIALAEVVAVVGRHSLAVFGSSSDLSGDVGLVGPLLALCWVAIISLLGGYRPEVFGATVAEYRLVLNGSVLTAGLLGVGCYLTRFPLSRGFFFLLFAIGIPALLVGRFLHRRIIHRARQRGSLSRRVVVAGSLAHVDEIAAVLRRETWLGYDVVGALTPPVEHAEHTPYGVPVLGNADDVVSVATEAQADVIFFAGGAVGSSHDLRELIWELEHESVSVVVAPSVSEISSDRINVRPVAGLPLMHIDPPSWIDAARIGKRIFDLAGALLLLLVVSPVLAICALSVWASDGGPVFFRQLRIGRDGAEFRCWKFRTMVIDAETLLGDLRTAETVNGALFKMKDDPRITRPGRWLRRFSLDELPQLINVLRGEMSLVGPRPPLPSEVLSYASQTSRRLRVRPGMTGLWQVSGRSDLSFEEAIRLDLYYVDNWSMVQDLVILLRTAGAVLSSRGAY